MPHFQINIHRLREAIQRIKSDTLPVCPEEYEHVDTSSVCPDEHEQGPRLTLDPKKVGITSTTVNGEVHVSADYWLNDHEVLTLTFILPCMPERQPWIEFTFVVTPNNICSMWGWKYEFRPPDKLTLLDSWAIQDKPRKPSFDQHRMLEDIFVLWVMLTDYISKD